MLSVPMASRRVLKMNGLGNAIVVADLRGVAGEVGPAQARAISALPETGFDQLMVIHDPITPGTDALVRILNTDGSTAGACGNGTRCVAWAMTSDAGMGRDRVSRLRLETAAGVLEATRQGPLTFTVDMGPPRLGWQDIPLAEPFHDTSAIELQIGPIDAPVLHTPGAVSMGNPHVVFFVDDPYAHDLGRIGPLLEHHPLFPERANISLAAVTARDRIVLRVWERGAGLTLACGSGACAALVAAVRRGLADREATVSLPGGDLRIAWRESDGHLLMTGPVELEREVILPPQVDASLVDASLAGVPG